MVVVCVAVYVKGVTYCWPGKSYAIYDIAFPNQVALPSCCLFVTRLVTFFHVAREAILSGPTASSLLRETRSGMLVELSLAFLLTNVYNLTLLVFFVFSQELSEHS